jgi:hypothetical protein
MPWKECHVLLPEFPELRFQACAVDRSAIAILSKTSRRSKRWAGQGLAR